MPDDAVIEQPEVDIVEQPYEEPSVTERDGFGHKTVGKEDEDQLENEPVIDKVDGRKFNPEMSQFRKQLREGFPDKIDLINRIFDNAGRHLATQEKVPGGLDEITDYVNTIKALGGREAAAELMSRAASFDAIDSKLEASDATVIDDLPENLQKGFYGMIPDALTRLSESNPEAFNAAVAPHFKQALAATGMGEHLKQMWQVAGDNEPLKALIQKQYSWYQEQTQGVGAMPKTQATPQQSRAEQELATIRQQQDQGFVKNVTEGAVKYQGESFEKNVGTYLKQLNLSDAQKADLQDSFNAKLVDKMAGDAAFQKQLTAYKSMKGRDPQTVADYVNATIDKYAKPIMDGLVTARYGKRAPAAAPVSTTTTSNGAIRVAQPPSQDQWDMDKMEALGYSETAKKGIFHLKGGKTVQLSRPN